MIKISVIVPVYNVEKYINRCIESLINQTYKNIEIILIDDGSPDNSPKICDMWTKKDKRIKVYHKKNSGLGYSRNFGLDVATGDYVSFVDSDDYIDINTFKNCVEVIEKYSLDVCRFGMVEKFAHKDIFYDPPVKQLYNDDDNIEFAKDIIGKSVDDSSRLFAGISACTSIYSLKLLKRNNIHFTSERETLCEDIIFNFEVSLNAKKTYILKENYYYYCHHESSLTTSYRKDRFDRTINLFDFILNRHPELFNSGDFRIRLIRLILQNIIVCLKQEIEHRKKIGLNNSFKNIKNIVINKKLNHLLKEYPINSMPFKQKFLFKAIKLKMVLIVYLIVYIKCYGERDEIK